jgi:nucleotide-binding universal stress UspA family protein
MKDCITILADYRFFPYKAFQLASLLAKGFDKSICFLSFVTDTTEEKAAKSAHKLWSEQQNTTTRSQVTIGNHDKLSQVINELEASFLLIEFLENSRYVKVQAVLNMCRTIRIPYVFINEHVEKISLKRVIIPVGFLTEENEKGIFASKLARFCSSAITLLQAKDYGSRAARSIGQIKTLFEKLSIDCTVLQARKDSFKVQQEAAVSASKGNADLVIITASREYGLDDILFGPDERKIIASSQVPVMVLNPRSDLYVLCD